jgi:hypothetical protein
VNTAQLASAGGPRTADEAKDLDRTNHESFALLLFAVKDWGLGAWEDAGALFEQFQSATPDEHSVWLNALKPIAAKCLADLATYRSLVDTARSGQDIDVLSKAVETARAARAKQPATGKFSEKLGEVESALAKQLASVQEAKGMKEAEMEASDTKALADALVRVNESFAAFLAE